MSTKIAINGFGRIGRPLFRRIIEKHPDLEVVAINDLTDAKTLSHLLKYDSVYGVFNKKIDFTEKSFLIEGKEFRIFAEKEPSKLPWKDLGVDVVLECTGKFTSADEASVHIQAGAKKVIISAPADGTPSFILGVNAEKYDPKKDHVVDMGSCTTNCLAPVAKILQDNFGIVKGFMTTVHAYTNDQRILDLSHKDLRRARAAATNIIPTSTGAAKAIGKVIPELEGKLDGIAMRVPIPTVSVLDLICVLNKETTADNLKETFKKAAIDRKYQGIFAVEESPLVSSDYIGNSYSSIVDLPLVQAKGNLVKVVAWYDNEFAYACRLAEFAEYIGKKMK
jgi:glyceraldehyde 3-phosphate dehydrogenase